MRDKEEYLSTDASSGSGPNFRSGGGPGAAGDHHAPEICH